VILEVAQSGPTPNANQTCLCLLLVLWILSTQRQLIARNQQALRPLLKIGSSKPNFKHHGENDRKIQNINWLQSLILIHGPQIDFNIFQ